MPQAPSILTGRRGFWRYLYGSHGWLPAIDGNWLRGIIRDTSRPGIPAGGLYDAADFLLHEPGVAIKRGGTTFAGPVMAGVSVAPYRGAALGFLPGLYLEFEDALGSTTFADSSGNANNGSAASGITLQQVGLVPGGSGYSAYWDSTNAITVADATTLNPTSSVSVAAWVQTHLGLQQGGTFQILQKGSLSLYLTVTTTLVNHTPIVTGSSISYSVKDSGGHTITGTWDTTGKFEASHAGTTRFLVVTDDGTTISVYLDGTLLSSKTRASLNASATTGFSGVSGSTMYVGGTATGSYWSGLMDEFGFYKDVTLSGANVTTLWNDRLAVSAATKAWAVAYAEYPAGSQLVGVGDNGELYQIANGSTTALGGQTVTGGVLDRPRLRIGGTQHLLIVPCGDGTSAPVAYDGSAAPTTLGGSPPAMRYIEIHKSRLVGGGNAANPNRLFFSPALDIASTWDTSESWIDTSHAITGLASLHNSLLVFSLGHVEILTGSTPPPGSDMALAPLGEEGCTDARSIVVQEGNCIYANSRGVWLTNGAGFTSLTALGGIDSYWQKILEGYDPSTWSIAAGQIRNFYIVTIIDNLSNVTTLMCNVPQRSWWRLTNINAAMYAQGIGKQEELYYADAFLPRVTSMSGMFFPSASNRFDADGTPVQPLLETRAIGDGPELKALGNCHVSLDMRDAATDNPTMTVEFARGVEATSFQTATESPLTETTDMTRYRFSTGGDSAAITIRLQQQGASSKTEVYSLEVETRPYPVAAEGQ